MAMGGVSVNERLKREVPFRKVMGGMDGREGVLCEMDWKERKPTWLAS